MSKVPRSSRKYESFSWANYDPSESDSDSDDAELGSEIKFCPKWDLGTCTKGEKCRFRHRKIDNDYNSSAFLVSLILALKLTADNNTSLNNTEREKMFNELGKTRRETIAGEKDKESDMGEGYEDAAHKRWEEDDEFEKDQTNGITRTLKEMCMKKSLSKGKGKEKSYKETETDRACLNSGNTNAVSTEQYIVLESNLVTCGPGLEISQIIPGYDLCQITLQLPVESTTADIEEALSEEGLTISDYHILRVEKRSEELRVVLISDAKFGRDITARQDGQTVWSQKQGISFEVRDDAIWTSGTMQGKQPSLSVTWSSNTGSRGEEASNALSDVYDSLLDTSGARMENFYLLTPDTGSSDKVELIVEFDNWNNCLQAARNINANHQHSVPSLECFTSIPFSVRIPIAQYTAQKKQWRDLSEARDEKEADLDIMVLEHDVNIQVKGEDRASVGALKVRVERLIRGELLEGTYWHPSFSSSEDSDKFFQDVIETATVHLQCRPETRALILYGESEKVNEARRMIQEEVHRREQVMTKTKLKEDSVEFFVRDGYQKLRDLFGEDVELRVTSKWSAIMMRGGEEATHHLRRLIRESLVKQPSEVQSTSNEVTCAVCFSEVSCPETLECGHAYCAGCLNLFLKAAGDNKVFPIVCIGDGAECNVPIALPFIRRFLPHHTFKCLVEAAFASHLERSATEFRYCRTADCRQTYRREESTGAVMRACPSCLAKTCTFCAEDHENMTCEEYRIYRDPEEQERLNQDLYNSSGYKRCPRCVVWIEKNGGCNHMECNCGAHICWICLGVFEPGMIYGHISTTHPTAG